MGIDARIYVSGGRELSDLECGALAKYLSYGYDQHIYAGLDYDGWLQVEGMERLFSSSYPRGDWPLIRQAIEYLQRLFPDSEIRYGSDHDDDVDDAIKVTPEYLAQLDADWKAECGDR